MRYQVTGSGATHDVRIEERKDALEITVNGRALALDVAECADGVVSLIHNGQSFEFHVDPGANGAVEVLWRGGSMLATVERGSPASSARSRVAKSRATGQTTIATPMPGKVVAVLVSPGDRVKKGQGVVVVEAMKMENELAAPCGGVVKAVRVSPGDKVESHAILAVIEEAS